MNEYTTIYLHLKVDTGGLPYDVCLFEFVLDGKFIELWKELGIYRILYHLENGKVKAREVVGELGDALLRLCMAEIILHAKDEKTLFDHHRAIYILATIVNGFRFFPNGVIHHTGPWAEFFEDREVNNEALKEFGDKDDVKPIWAEFFEDREERWSIEGEDDE